MRSAYFSRAPVFTSGFIGGGGGGGGGLFVVVFLWGWSWGRLVRVAHLFWSSLTYIYTMLTNNAINHLLPKSFKTKETTTYAVGTPDLCFEQAQIVAGLERLMGFKSSPSS